MYRKRSVLEMHWLTLFIHVGTLMGAPLPRPYLTTRPAATHCHSLQVCPATQSESLKQSMWARFMSSGTQATYGEFSSL